MRDLDLRAKRSWRSTKSDLMAMLMLLAVLVVAIPLVAEGGLSAGLFFAALAASSTIVDVSPFSTNGALMLANKPDTIDDACPTCLGRAMIEMLWDACPQCEGKGGACMRCGPTGSGETRSDSTGSVMIRTPSISTSTLE